MSEFTVVSVEESMEGSKDSPLPCWRVRSEDGEGQVNEHLMPQNILAWRIAEFDLDPEDPEPIWDMILNERFAAELDPNDPDLRSTPQARRSEASPAAQALEAHQRRIELAKEKIGRVRMPSDAAQRSSAKASAHPLDQLLNHRVDEREVEECRQHVRAMRGEGPDPRLPPRSPSLFENAEETGMGEFSPR